MSEDVLSGGEYVGVGCEFGCGGREKYEGGVFRDGVVVVVFARGVGGFELVGGVEDDENGI